MKRTIDNVTTLITYDGWKPVAEWNGAGGLVAWNLYGPGADEILVRYDANASKHLYYHLDAQGHVRFLLDENGQVLDKYTFDAFGQPKIMDGNGVERTTTSNGNRFLFTGREYLSALSLYDYRHRVYHPALGRFLQIDPLGLQIEGAKLTAQQTALYPAGTAPKTFSSSELNLYRYCHNDPVNRTDPTGLEDANYFDNGILGVGREPLRKWITRSPDDARTFTVAAHGVDGGRTMWDANRKIEMSPKQLFDRTKNSPELKRADRIMLYSCQLGAGGKDSFAQKYADLTGKTVLAPTKDFWVDKKGVYFSAGTLSADPNKPNEPPRPNYADPGRLRFSGRDKL